MEEAAAPRLEDPVERRLELLAVARLAVGNTDSRRRNSDNLRMQRTDPGRHSTEHTVRCSPTLGFRLLRRRECLAELEQPQGLRLGTAGHRSLRIHPGCRTLDDRLVGSRLHIPAAGEGLL